MTILLSGPDMDESDRDALIRAFDSGWIAPVGPELNAFENELAEYVGTEACVALSSGTAALHLALLDAGVGGGDEVVVQSATFAASAFAVVHAGAIPVFCDISAETWAMDPQVLKDLLSTKAAKGKLPKAVMPVDLYGSCADYESLNTICSEFGVAVIEDAAEALGSISDGKQAGTFGRSAALSFNGNKIMTTSGGGALVGSEETISAARNLSTQARSPVSNIYHEHDVIGYNYRLSNILAALGRSQLARLESKIERRAEIHHAYRSHPSLEMLDWGRYAKTERPNYWLNIAMLPKSLSATAVSAVLGEQGIEARPAWKPMHRQPVFASAEMFGGHVSEELFNQGLCLPSGSGLTDDEVALVADALAVVLDSAA